MTLSTIREGLWYQLPQSVLQRYAAGKNEARLKFKSNYYKLQFRSIAVGLSAYSLAARSIYLLVVGASALSVLANVVISIFLFVIWNKWDPTWVLTEKAWEAMKSFNPNCEEEVLKYIESGADLFRYHSQKLTLWLAAFYGRERVVQTLLQLNPNLDLNEAFKGASSVNIARMLFEAGAELNPDRHSSLLSQHVDRILEINNLTLQRDEIFLQLKIPVVNFLLDQGARFNHLETQKLADLITKLRELSGSTNCTINLRDSINQVIQKLERL